MSSARQLGVFLLLLVWPQAGSDKQTLRQDMRRISQFWHMMCDICCSVNLSGAISPTVECVLLLSVWPQAGPDRRRLRLNSYGVSYFLSPTVVCVYITMDMATSKVGQTDTETRYVLYFAIVTCCV